MPKRSYHQPSDAINGALSAEEYHTHRLTHGYPEAAYDSEGSDVAMDLGYDALGAISFTKGCYIGQEVTARMHYKQIARKAILRVTSAGEIGDNDTFSPITCGASDTRHITLASGQSRLGTNHPRYTRTGHVIHFSTSMW